MSCFFDLLVFAAAGALALTSPHPAPTDKTLDSLNLGRGFTPKPTASPALPAVGYTNLFARSLQQPLFTCGYQDGDVNYPNVCGASSACSFGSGPDYYFGCCQFTGSIVSSTWQGSFGDDCYTVASCVEYDEHPYTISGASLSGGDVLCGASARYCATTYISDVPGHPGDEGYYTHYDCVSAASSGDVVYLDWSTSDENDYYTGTDSYYYSYSETYTTTSHRSTTSTTTRASVSVSVQTVVSVSIVESTSFAPVAAAPTATTSSRVSTTSNGAQATAVMGGVAGLVAVAGVAMML